MRPIGCLLVCAPLATLALGAGDLPCQSTGIWTRLLPANSPPPCFVFQMAYDVARDGVVLVNAAGNQPSPLDVWEFDGQDWHQVGPPSPIGIGFAWWDDLRGQVVALHYQQGLSSQCTLYGWTGSTWQVLTQTSPAPQVLTDGTWSYDDTRRVAVWYLGDSNRSDTWEWNGSVFQQRSAGGPIPRIVCSSVFDRGRAQVLLFGGESSISTAHYSDTWTWNGTAWIEHFGISHPPARVWPMMACDPVRNRVMLYGGRTGTSGSCLGDTWEWDGTAWTLAATTGQPPALCQSGLVYDSLRHRYVLFGGRGSNDQFFNETWVYEAVDSVQGSVTNFGQGCPGPAGTPQLGAVSGSRPIIGQTFHMQLTNLPNTFVNFPFTALGSSNQSFAGAPLPASMDFLGATGCTLYVSIDQQFSLTNVNGSAAWDIPIPFQLGLVGLDAFIQGAVLVPGFNPASLVVTNAAHAVVGSN